MSKYSKRMLNRIRREFMEEKGDDKSFETAELARWALTAGKVRRPAGYAEQLVERQLAREFAEAMREDYGVDPQGRTVREMHAARIGGRTRWNSRSGGSRGFIETSVRQRRDQIVGDCRHLKTDVDSLNDNRWPDNPIQLPLDFTIDVAELEAGERKKKAG
jgi:hypothetical protein